MTIAYPTSDSVLVYLIQQSMDGSPERRLAANFILDCLRNCKTQDEIVASFYDLEDHAILDVAKDAQELAVKLRLIK